MKLMMILNFFYSDICSTIKIMKREELLGLIIIIKKLKYLNYVKHRLIINFRFWITFMY